MITKKTVSRKKTTSEDKLEQEFREVVEKICEAIYSIDEKGYSFQAKEWARCHVAGSILAAILELQNGSEAYHTIISDLNFKFRRTGLKIVPITST